MMILPLKISIFCRAPETFAGAYFYINEAMLQHKIRILPLTNDGRFGATRCSSWRHCIHSPGAFRRRSVRCFTVFHCFFIVFHCFSLLCSLIFTGFHCQSEVFYPRCVFLIEWPLFRHFFTKNRCILKDFGSKERPFNVKLAASAQVSSPGVSAQGVGGNALPGAICIKTDDLALKLTVLY